MSYCDILSESRTIAVVGISRHQNRTSREIAEYLKNAGYKVVGVNPAAPVIDGIPVYASLKDIPFKIDVVDVFRRSEDIPAIIDDVLAIKPKTLWLQLGIRNDEAVEPARKAGIKVVQDYCIKIAHWEC